jgi:hypothetical protein
VALPPGASVAEVRAVRVRAHTRPPRKGERPLARGSGRARIERVNRLFGLGADDLPGPSLLSWSGPADLPPDGEAFEVPLGAGGPSSTGSDGAY